ncbi:MAG: PqqD family peptide modification chaperone [Thermodesulfobacteriota bacterium]
MSETKTYLKNPFVFCNESEIGATLLNLETKYYYRLNDTSLRIWELLDEFSNPLDIAEKMAYEYKISAEKALGGVLELIRVLEKEGMILLDKTQGKKIQNELTLVVTGDSIITQRISAHDEEEFLSMIELIRSADIAFTNLEVLIHSYEGYPTPDCQGTHMAADPFVATELRWAGFNLFSRANNHALDYGIEGMRTTSKILDELNLAHAGVGENLALARAPAYLEAKRGRVALISCSSTFPTFYRAGEQRQDVKGRPGLNPLRFNTTYLVDSQFMDEIKRIGAVLKLSLSESKESSKFLGNQFTIGDSPRTITTPHESDLKGNIESIKDARRQAELVLVSHHAHEGEGDIELPAEFIVSFARACIDAGADVYICHGPHVLRGIEIYKRRPIFYSLGNFIFQHETVKFHPAEAFEDYGLESNSLVSALYYARQKKDKRRSGFYVNSIYWVSVIPQLTFKNGMLNQIKLYPISLGFGKPIHKRGRPMLANKVLGQKIINRIKRLSSPFGAEIIYEDGVGLVKMN